MPVVQKKGERKKGDRKKKGRSNQRERRKSPSREKKREYDARIAVSLHWNRSIFAKLKLRDVKVAKR